MDEYDWLAERFEENRPHLRAVAYRVLQQANAVPEAEAARRQEIVGAFLAASRAGDFEALLAMLDPDIVLRTDAVAAQMTASGEVRGALAAAAIFSGRAAGARLALVDGVPGMMWAQGGQIRVVFDFTIVGGKIAAIEMTADPEHLTQLDVVPLTARAAGQRR